MSTKVLTNPVDKEAQTQNLTFKWNINGVPVDSIFGMRRYQTKTMTEIVTSTSGVPSDILRAVAPADAGKSVAVATGASKSETAGPPPDIRETIPALSEAELNKQVAEKVDQLNHLAKDRDLSVEFSVDESTNRQVVRIIDKKSGDVRMQLPSEAALTVSKNLDVLRGVFLDDFV